MTTVDKTAAVASDVRMFPLPGSATSCKAPGHCRCSICAKLPLRTPNYMYTMWDNGLMFDNVDIGMFDLLPDFRRTESRVPYQIASRAADNAQRHLKHLQKELAELGLMTANQKFSGCSQRARMMAPFHRSELVLGPRLGSGGFSTVSEVAAFCLKDAPDDDELDQTEQAARSFLSDHAHRVHPPKKSKRGRNKSMMHYPLRTTARYAVKHLKRSLIDNEDKFEKAAVDLALEAQLLLVMDHPNIISLRGWARHGTDAFRGGCPGDYFLVLDCLPETLDDRIFTWRQSFRKYKSRSTMPWNRKKFETKRRNLLVERLMVAHDIASAIEYLHEKRVINRDIKTSNIGFDHDGTVQIFDLGLARLLPKESDSMHDGYVMSRVGTKSTMAPEVYKREPYNLSADVYSYGVVLWEILSLSTSGEYFRRQRRRHEYKNDKAPDHGPEQDERENAGEDDKQSGETKGTTSSRRKCPLPICSCWPEAMQDLLRSCLSHDASKRPSMTEVREAIREQMEGLGVSINNGPKRRRSTFRLDLTHVDMSAKSKTSLASTALDFGSFSDQHST